jgi:hypothetical protein
MTIVEVNAMHLRLSGYSPQQAQEITRQVSKQLAGRVSSLSAGGWQDGLDLKLRIPEGQTPEQLSKAIVQAILEHFDR